MTAFGSIETTIEAIKCGAHYYLEKPFPPDAPLH
jgi:ActR/RegA family two-component response regulator